MRHNFVLGRLPCCVTSLLLHNIKHRPTAVTRLLLGCLGGIDCTKTVITSHENRHCAVTTAAFGQGSDQLRERIRYLHYSLPTEQAYVHWFVPSSVSTVCVTRQPWAAAKSRHFVPLANERKVSVSTHRQALWLLFFYGKVLCTDLPWLQEIGRPRPSRRLPVVLTRMKWFASSVFWKASIVCSPSCMERHADQ